MRPKYDPEIMQELLDKVGVRVQLMTPKELEFYKELLVSQGIYARYVLERNKQKLKEAWNGSRL